MADACPETVNQVTFLPAAVSPAGASANVV
jgi:hypothetical protein